MGASAAHQKLDLKGTIAASPDTNIVVPALSPVQAVTAKRELKAAGRAVFVVNDYQRPTTAEQKARTVLDEVSADLGL